MSYGAMNEAHGCTSERSELASLLRVLMIKTCPKAYALSSGRREHTPAILLNDLDSPACHLFTA